MSYVRQNFVDGQVLSASHLNHIEDELIDLETRISDSGGNAGLTVEQITALDSMFKVCAFIKSDVSAEYISFKTAFGISDSGDVHIHSYTSTVTTAATCTATGVRTYTCSCGDTYTKSIPVTAHNYVDGVCSVCGAADPNYNPDVTLTSISATYSGGDVPAGTAVTDLTGIVVTAHYSDGTSKAVTGFTLSGTIVEGSNTVTVTYQGKTATFTVTGVAETASKWVNDTVVLTSDDLLYGYASDWSKPTTVPPYTNGNTARAGYLYQDIDVEYGYTYKVDVVSEPEVSFAPIFWNESAFDYAETSTRIPQDCIYEPGWQSNGAEIILPELFSGTALRCLRLSFKTVDGSAVVDGFIQSVTITRTVSAFENKDSWVTGYVNTTGARQHSNATNGEMMTDEFMPVTPGETYRFYNTNSEWCTTWTGVGYYTEPDASTFVSRFVNYVDDTTTFTEVVFTIPDGVNYMRISSNRLAGYIETVKYELVE